MRRNAMCAVRVLGVVATGLLVGAPVASAESPVAQWTISAVSNPTNLSPSAEPGEDYYRVLLTNTGGAASNGPVTVTDELPAGLSIAPRGASGVDPVAEAANGGFEGDPGLPSSGEPATAHFSCALASCTYSAVVIPDETLELRFPVVVGVEAGTLSPLTNVIRAAGGGARTASLSMPTTVSEERAGFGMPVGAASTAFSTLQAGAHSDITTSYGFSTVDAGGVLAGEPKDVTYLLAPGFASDFADTPQCTNAQFIIEQCPVDSQVGVTSVVFWAGPSQYGYFVVPVFNLAPEAGTLATLAFSIGGDFFIQGQITLRSSDHGADVTFHNVNDGLVSIAGGSLSVWGVPSNPVHNPWRWDPAPTARFGVGDEGTAVAPYFTNPTSCSAPLHSEFQTDDWEEPGRVATSLMRYGPMFGCDSLQFEPQVEVQPSTESAETATGLNVNIQSPQHYENAYGDVAPNLDGVKVVLPRGMTLNPSAGAGLAACSEAQFAYEGEVLEPEAGLGCPRESKLGSLHVRSPGVPHEEEAFGSLYLAKPYENKFGSLIAVYLVARIPDRGIVVAAAGRVEANAQTGQLTTTFEENPQLPFSHLTFTFHQGATSPLVTPPTCGAYTSEAALTPWSVPAQEILRSSVFEVTSGIGGGPCPSGGVPPFAPRLISGTQDNSASSYSPFYLRIVREDGEQELTKFTTVLPPGLTGNLTGVPFCPEGDIEAARKATGTEELEHSSCPAASEIGHTIVEAGVGSVLAQTPGKLYLAGPYHGAPLSVLSVTAAKVGPFDLGTVVIRFALDINPVTAQVEIDGATSDPIPHIIDGIVVHVRDIRAYVDREKFIENPTSCNPLAVTDTIYGVNSANTAQITPVDATSAFQAADCQNLAFKPTFKVSTPAKTSRTEGTSLTVKLAYPTAPQGTQANIRLVKVELPKQLPSRLSTLQKACTEAVFDANPAMCPSTSIIGHAKAVTPILPEPLEGPAYFVSHGGAKWPELIMVLQGYGFTIDLHGETLISKTGVTSSTFHAIPDEPVTSFELTLPRGRYSALTGLGNLCKSTLTMPTQFIAQNGMEVRQNTKVAVTGCPKKAKRASRKQHRHKHGSRAKRRGKGKKKG
jgi:uncharacterized repeat protein (TIGR01451 family)